MEPKDYMTMEEMQALHKEWYPYLTLNRVNVGRLATRLGYTRIQQVRDGKFVSIYLKKDSKHNRQ
jgi:hypothetical protein